MQEVVRYTVAVHDGDRGQQPPRWAQATARSWLPQPPLPQLGPLQQPGPPRLMAAGQPPFQVPIFFLEVWPCYQHVDTEIKLTNVQADHEVHMCREVLAFQSDLFFAVAVGVADLAVMLHTLKHIITAANA